jgi:hypothetical protein
MMMMLIQIWHKQQRWLQRNLQTAPSPTINLGKKRRFLLLLLLLLWFRGMK